MAKRKEEDPDDFLTKPRGNGPVAYVFACLVGIAVAVAGVWQLLQVLGWAAAGQDASNAADVVAPLVFGLLFSGVGAWTGVWGALGVAGTIGLPLDKAGRWPRVLWGLLDAAVVVLAVRACWHYFGLPRAVLTLLDSGDAFFMIVAVPAACLGPLLQAYLFLNPGPDRIFFPAVNAAVARLFADPKRP